MKSVYVAHFDCFFSSRRRHTRCLSDWSSDVCSSDLKQRWQIELFFKALKQNLRLKTFIGTSANALKTQVWAALIAMLLIKYLQLKATFGWSLSNLVDR